MKKENICILYIMCLLSVFLFFSAIKSNAETANIISLALVPEQNEIKGNVGETGKLTLGEYEGVTLEGEFKPLTNDIISIDKDGTWKALKEGTTSYIAHVTLTQKTIDELTKQFPGREIVYQEIAPKNITIIIKGSSELLKNGKDIKKELPKTNEYNNSKVIIVGICIILIFMSHIMKQIFINKV